jgi:hypothetical protein
VDIRRISLNQTIQKVPKYPLNEWTGAVAYAHLPLDTNRRTVIETSLVIKPVPVSKITKVKKGWQHGSSGRVPD